MGITVRDILMFPTPVGQWEDIPNAVTVMPVKHDADSRSHHDCTNLPQVLLETFENSVVFVCNYIFHHGQC